MPLAIVRAKWGLGSFLTFDLMGETSPFIDHIWVYLCDWVLAQGDEQVLTSSGIRPKGSDLLWFSRRSLIGIELYRNDWAIDLFFDGDLSLRLSPNLTAYSPKDDLVMFFRSGHGVAAFSYENGFYGAP